MEETLLKLRILAGAELTLARIRARRLAAQVVLLVIALSLLLLTVVMVNIGVYQLLAQTYGGSTPAFIVALGNAILALVLVLVASRIKPGAEEVMAREIRELALAEVATDVDEVRQQVGRMGTDVKRIRSGFSILAKGGSIGAGIASLAPVLGMLIEMIKHRREKKAKEASE